MRSADVNSSTYIGPKFAVADHKQISKCKNIFAKFYAPNWSEEVFPIKKFKYTVSWTYVISYLNCEEFFRTFYKKEFQKTNKTDFKISSEKVIKRSGHKLNVKWKGYDNLVNSWIDKKRLHYMK